MKYCRFPCAVDLGTCIHSAFQILTVFPGAESNNQILDGPRDAIVLAGSEARFNCTVSQGWKLIMWALNGVVVLSLTPTQAIITNERFTSESYQVDSDFISELIIRDVQLKDAGQVRCSLQDSDRDSSALLAVQGRYMAGTQDKRGLWRLWGPMTPVGHGKEDVSGSGLER